MKVIQYEVGEPEIDNGQQIWSISLIRLYPSSDGWSEFVFRKGLYGSGRGGVLNFSEGLQYYAGWGVT